MHLGGYVLIVESNQSTLDQLYRLFSRNGVTSRSVSTISAAIRELKDPPALVVINLALRDGNGVEVLKSIQQQQLDCKVAIFASLADAPSPNWMPTYHPDAVFGKPFDFLDFKSWLSETFSSLTKKLELKSAA